MDAVCKKIVNTVQLSQVISQNKQKVLKYLICKS